MNTLELIKDYSALIALGIALVVWAVRVEAKANKNADDNKRNTEDIKRTASDLKDLKRDYDDVLKEIRQDIKTLLSRER